MKIKQIQVKNFRLLDNATVNIEDDLTLIVGKNNTGKTSLFEIINVFTQQTHDISFEDFSQSSYRIFKKLYKFYKEYYLVDINETRKEKSEILILKCIPKIKLIIQFEYDIEKDSLINLSEFITDLDENRNDASVLISYEPKESLNLFKSFNDKGELIPWLKENLRLFYQLKCYAIDKDSEFRKEIDISFKNKIKQIVSFESIKASRNLDDVGKDKSKTLQTGFSDFYKESNKEDNSNVEDLETVLTDFSSKLDTKYKVVLDDILKEIKNFGIEPHVTIPTILLKSEFNSETILKNNIKYYYENGEIPLPENYNGLGYSNLIFLVLKVVSFIEKFKKAKAEDKAEFLTILIEEPEAHLHPQMQQVFIKQITKLIKETNISVQLIISSHSSHIIAEAGIDIDKGFDRIRYFNKIDNEIEINDFNNFKHKDNDKETFRFLKQYLNLHKCDIFFADKVIMVEGVTEKMLLPLMIDKVAPSLKNEYISILEVGGAYTQKFKEILHFIKIKTLVITDIDSVDASLPQGKECRTDLENAVTSNSTLKDWIPKKITISELNVCLTEEKFDGNLIRATYQIKESNENTYVARSLEEAIINKNLIFFKSEFTKEQITKKIKSYFTLINQHSPENLENMTCWELRPKSSSAKTNFTFDLMTFSEEETGLKWEVPLYIKEGLEWLANNNTPEI
ncbi:putative ATP-dependent endonuclease of OLD family [Chryseobacterium defluvii]|uniref:Putative ATP-dependent endonuclease of OLD family n=1 Tax=Chryseobacterium defluvii TaxID=160396 RepID=A0A840KMW5_9FLAO|nr:AAA family ATPase [Chryseobacterium defluvii]MBB4808182.1 putative ATP-dependent endonuclease of OLD family [Chryseobacterium defluvii]